MAHKAPHSKGEQGNVQVHERLANEDWFDAARHLDCRRAARPDSRSALAAANRTGTGSYPDGNWHPVRKRPGEVT